MQEQVKKPHDTHEDYLNVRPHHGLCGEFFQGKGYSGEFVENMSAVLDRLNGSNPLIKLTAGTDIICCRCPHCKAKPCTKPTGICETEKKVSRYDEAVLNLCGLSEGDILRWEDFRTSVRENIISAGRLEQVCGDCTWFGICEKQ